MTQHEIREQCYVGTNEEYLYDGFTAEQWEQIADEHDSADERKIARVLRDLNREAGIN